MSFNWIFFIKLVIALQHVYIGGLCISYLDVSFPSQGAPYRFQRFMVLFNYFLGSNENTTIYYKVELLLNCVVLIHI
jgi:hypothetical protein